MSSDFSRRTMLRAAGAAGLAAAGGFGTPGNAVADEVDPPRLTVLRHKKGATAGEIHFTWSLRSGGAAATSGMQIADAAGTPLWSTSTTAKTFIHFRRQVYRGRDVLSWFQGPPSSGGGGREQLPAWVLTELDHTPIATIGASGEFHPDLHEQRVSRVDTGLVASYTTLPGDLSGIGGAADGLVVDSYANELDIASGTMLRRWRSLDHVPITDSYAPPPRTPEQSYDYFHINSIDVAPDGHLLLSARNTCALYKVHRVTGEVIWTLGGKSSSFDVAPDAVFAFQHEAVFENPRTIRLFDNGSDGQTTLHPTRVVWLRIDERRMTVSLANSVSIPGIAQATGLGSSQRLPNGNVFVCWGRTPRLSEFSPRGDLLFDATLPSPCYRAFKYPRC